MKLKIQKELEKIRNLEVKQAEKIRIQEENRKKEREKLMEKVLSNFFYVWVSKLVFT